VAGRRAAVSNGSRRRIDRAVSVVILHYFSTAADSVAMDSDVAVYSSSGLVHPIRNLWDSLGVRPRSCIRNVVRTFLYRNKYGSSCVFLGCSVCAGGELPTTHGC